MASGDLGTLYYEVSADTAGLLNAEKDVTRSTGRMASDFQRADRSADGLTVRMNQLAVAIKAVIAASALRGMARMVQDYQTMSERVRMATNSTAEFELVQRRLQETASGTYRDLAEAQEVYIQTSAGLRNMGYEAEEALDIVDSLSYAFVRNQTSADRAASALNVLTRATNRGTVLTDHWATLLIAVPTILDDVAAATGLSTKEISRMGYEGKLSADMLTQGLLQSRDANKAAADSMAGDLRDAAVIARNALTEVLSSIESQTGALQGLTDGLISASKFVLDFAQDTDKMETATNALAAAAVATGGVMAGRFMLSLYESAKAMASNTAAARLKAAQLLQSAQATAKASTAELASAQAEERAARGTNEHAAALMRLKMAKDANTLASNQLAVANRGYAAAATLAGRAAATLRNALAFLGGPAGIVLAVAGALYTLYSRSKDATQSVEELTQGISDLGDEALKLRKIEIANAIEETAGAIEKSIDKIGNMETALSELEKYTDTKHYEEKLQRERAELERLRAELIKYAEAQNEVEAGIQSRANRGQGGGGATGTAEPTTSEGGQRYLQRMRDELALMREQGLAREKLAAIQRLGAEATKDEREEAERLATQIYELTQAQEAAKEATEEARKEAERAEQGRESNIETLANLEEQIHQASLSSLELAKRQAELSLNEYATPEQIERVKELATELHKLQEDQERRRAFGDDAAATIRGDFDPLSGGAFDDQYARYQAEARAEEERYAAQLERLREAKELEIEVVGGYQALEEEMAEDHAKRMAQIDQAKMQMLLTAGEKGFGSLADMMKSAYGEQSAQYKTAFAAQKAFAIASAITAIKTGIALAAGTPWPGNLAAMASVAAATAGLVSDIQSVAMGSGRQYGGPVGGGAMHRINEDGRPEIFNAANGQQYLLPNRRGEVVSNSDAQASGGANVVVQLFNDPSRAGEVEHEREGEQDIIGIWVADLLGDGETAQAIQHRFGLAPQGI